MPLDIQKGVSPQQKVGIIAKMKEGLGFKSDLRYYPKVCTYVTRM